MLSFLKRHTNLLLNAVILGFFALYLQSLDFSDFDLKTINISILLFSIPASIAVRYFFPFAWVYAMRIIGAELKMSAELNYIYAKSWLGRYMPGKVTWLIGKAIYARSLGIKSEILALSSVLEVAAQVLTTGVIGFAFIILSGLGGLRLVINISDTLIAVLLFIGVTVFLFVASPVMNYLLLKVYKLRKMDTSKRIKLTRDVVFKSLSVFSLLALLNAIPQYIMYYSIVGSFGLSEFLYISGSFMVAGVIGILAVFAPGGLGVREGVLTVLLSQVVDPETALVIAVTQRLWSVLVDVLFFGLTYAWHKK